MVYEIGEEKRKQLSFLLRLVLNNLSLQEFRKILFTLCICLLLIDGFNPINSSSH